MPKKKERDSTAGVKLLSLFRKLMLDGRRHFLSDLSDELQCSPQTIIRLVAEIEVVIGMNLERGIDQRRRYYQIRTISRSRLGLDYEELRYLSICRDLAAPLLTEQVAERINESIFNLSVLLADQAYADRANVQGPQLAFYAKGRIDYSPHQQTIDKLIRASEEKLICMVSYKAPGRSQTWEHRFAPGSIVAMSNTLYVLGADMAKDYVNMKHLTNMAIHRIVEIVLTEKNFNIELPEPSQGLFGLPWHEPRTFRIKFAPDCADYIRERIWADQQKLEDLEDGGVILEITTRSEQELKSWVRSFGDLATLISPEAQAG